MVSISLIINSGIISKSKTAVDKYSQEEIQEQIKLAYSEWQMAKYSGETNDDAATFMQTKLIEVLGDNELKVEETGAGVFTVTLNGGKQYTYTVATGAVAKVKTVADYTDATPGTANNSENTKYTSDGKTAVIPAGYAISSVSTEQSINTGLVIKEVVDNNNDGIEDDSTAKRNEWVWIPVANVTDLYDTNTSNTEEWKLCGTDGNTKVVSAYKSKSEILSGKTRTTPGTTSDPYYREPDTLVGGGTQYDAVEANYTAAGFTSLSNMATSLRDDYKNMIDSVRKNGGFYVGRYELSNAGTKKDQPSLTNTNWYNLYAKCKTFGDESTTYSRMIWGCQWDQVCKFISTAKDKNGQTISLSNSTKYGNYKNSENSTQNKINTGSNDNYNTNNIYDLAGNCLEWTQEAYYTDFRAYRGGRYDYGGDNNPVTYRGSNGPDSSDNDSVSYRPVLYLK